MDPDNHIKLHHPSNGNAAIHWRRTRYLTIGLLASWFFLTFGILFFARELSGYTFFGWPFSFYMAAQGLTLFYVALLGVFSVWMRRIENAYLSKKPDVSSNKDSH